MKNPDQELLATYRPGDILPIETNSMARMLGATLIQLDRDTGRIALEFHPDARMHDAAGNVDIGATAAMLDFALGFVALSIVKPHERIATATLQMHLLKSARPGRLTAHALVEGRTHGTLFARGWLQNESDQMLVSGTASLPIFIASARRHGALPTTSDTKNFQQSR